MTIIPTHHLSENRIPWSNIRCFVDNCENSNTFGFKIVKNRGCEKLKAMSSLEKILALGKSIFKNSDSRKFQKLIEHDVAHLNKAYSNEEAIDTLPDQLRSVAEKFNQIIASPGKDSLLKHLDWKLCTGKAHHLQLDFVSSSPVKEDAASSFLPKESGLLQPYINGGIYYNKQGESRRNYIKQEIKVGTYTFLFSLPYVPPCPEPSDLAKAVSPLAQSQDLSIQWIGHASMLIQVDGVNIVTDPIFSDITPIDPRKSPPGVPFQELPRTDVILISHNHRDHLDKPAMEAYRKFQPLVMVPEGLKSWFTDMGFKHVIEHTWWHGTEFTHGEDKKKLRLSSVPAEHWSQRGIKDQNKSLWCGWLIESQNNKIYFSGDTAYKKEIGKQIKKVYGKIDVALLPIGPIEPRSSICAVHTNPDECLKMMEDLESEIMIPVHWGTFRQGPGGFNDGINELNKELSGRWKHMANRVVNLDFGERVIMKKEDTD